MTTSSADFGGSFEAQLELMTQLEVLRKEKNEMSLRRARNLVPAVNELRKEFSAQKGVLKSDLKKSNAFVKKLKTINTEGIQQCIADCATLNLNMFIAEIVSSLVATQFKIIDVPNVVRLCVELHQRYPEFTDELLQSLKQSLISPPADDDSEGGKKRRIQLRFLIELHQAGVFTEDDFFCRYLRTLVGKNKGANSTRAQMDLQGLSIFVKYGSESLLGFAPRKLVDLATRTETPLEDMPLVRLTSTATSAEMQLDIADAFAQLCTGLVKAHKDYVTRETKMEKDRVVHGTITDQKQLEFDNSKRLYEKLFAIVTTLSELLGERMPVLHVEKEGEEGCRSLSVWDTSGIPSGDDMSGGLYGDPETRSFYEDLPDLLTLVPLTVLGLTPDQAESLREAWERKAQVLRSGSDEANADIAASEAAVTAAMSASNGDEGMGVVMDMDGDSFGKGTAVAENEPEGVGGADENKANKFTAFLTDNLPECYNKQKADEFSTAFCYFTGKNTRKRLAQAIVRVPRSRSELPATYSRIIATLSRIYPDLAAPIIDMLRKEFYGMVKAKNQLYIDNKIKCVRYLGELVKFGVAPPITALRMYRSLMADFSLSVHNVELLAILLETCGRFLYMLPYTRSSMNEVMDTIVRLRQAKNLDLRLQSLLESAYFVVKPPENRAARTKTPLNPAQAFTRYLICDKLPSPKCSVEDTIKSLRRLPWNSREDRIAHHTVKACLKVARSQYTGIINVADCMSGLVRYYPNIVSQLVDRILEEIQRGLDSPYKREIQRLLGMMRLLGELYNFAAVSSTIIFDTLYHLLNFAHNVPPPLVTTTTTTTTGASGEEGGSGSQAQSQSQELSQQQQQQLYTIAGAPRAVKYDPRVISELDLPTDMLRVQLVCEMLNTVGEYFVRGAAKQRMTRFLLFFQRYLLTKKFIPLHIEFTVLDTLDNLEELARGAMTEAQLKALVTAATAEAEAAAKTAAAAAAAASITSGSSQSEEDVGASQSHQLPISINISASVFPRYDSLGAAVKAIELLEAGEATSGAGMAEEEDEEEEDDNDEGPAPVRAHVAAALIGEAAAEDDDDDDSEDDEDDSDSDSESDDSDSEDSDDGSDEEETDEDDEEDEEDILAAEARAEEEAARRMLEKQRAAEEEDEFERAFKSVMQENVTSAGSTANKSAATGNISRMAIPAVLPKPKLTAAAAAVKAPIDIAPGSNTEIVNNSNSNTGGGKVVFKLLSRDTKGRVEARQLLVPEENAMAVKLAKAGEIQRIEKLKLKQRILAMEAMNNDDNEQLNDMSNAHFGQRDVYEKGSGGVLRAQPTGQAGNGAVVKRGAGWGSTQRHRTEEQGSRRAMDLNLDEFLAESSASDIRRVSGNASSSGSSNMGSSANNRSRPGRL